MPNHQRNILCRGCGKPIKPQERSHCDICEPDMVGVMIGTARPKTPPLCSSCIKDHTKQHEDNLRSTTLTEEKLEKDLRDAHKEFLKGLNKPARDKW